MKSAWQQLIDEGYDVSLIEHNLALSPVQRINDQSDACESIGILRSAMSQQLQERDQLLSTAGEARRQ